MGYTPVYYVVTGSNSRQFQLRDQYGNIQTFDDIGQNVTVSKVSTDNSIKIKNHHFIEGEKVRIYNDGWFPPFGLSFTMDYYIKYVDANSFKLYSDDQITEVSLINADGSCYIVKDSMKHICIPIPFVYRIRVIGASYSEGDMVRLESSGELPGGLHPNMDYYIVNIDNNIFGLSEKSSGVSIKISSLGKGIHTVRRVFSENDLEIFEGNHSIELLELNTLADLINEKLATIKNHLI
jgi:hypothetical protein